MDLNKNNNTLCSIAVLVVLIVTTYVNAFKNNKFTCSRHTKHLFIYITCLYFYYSNGFRAKYKNVDLYDRMAISEYF